MTRTKVNAKGEGMILANLDEARRAYEAGAAELQANVKVRDTKVLHCSVHLHTFCDISHFATGSMP